MAAKRAHSGEWQLQEAKARLSEVVERALQGKPQRITRRGREAVVVISAKAFDAKTKPKESIVEFFARSPYRDVDLSVDRARDTGRAVDL
ncbi:MAG: type II toxin-antitoxin system Phd/YefM family antitoxin [bacterium]|nr:type II toxin-antitoxin system Phd/YefM family antitoxin [bacterium]